MKITQRHSHTVMGSDGKVQSHQTDTTYTYGEEPAYIKLYLQDIMYLSDMPRKYVAVTEALLKRVSYAGETNGMCVVLAPLIKKEICAELGWKSPASLDNALQKLLKGKILYRVDRGVFQFNPYLFGRGSWKDIESLRLDIDYSEIKGRTFRANIEYKEDDDGQFYLEVVNG